MIGPREYMQIMETFSKKEKEKQRQKKRKDKEEKREERKANAKKGQSLESMMVYVDENGNLVSTPPDPSRRKQINEADIQLGATKNDSPAEPVLRQGVVTFFNASKGYGFIKDVRSQESIFVHINALSEPLNEQDKVTFMTTSTPKGLNAVDVTKLT